MRGQAEEREQRFRIEEEGELDDPAVVDLDYLKRPRVVSAAGFARLVMAEGGRAVRSGRRNDARAATADTRPVPPFEDVVAPAQPQVERGIDCVASSWISEVRASMS